MANGGGSISFIAPHLLHFFPPHYALGSICERQHLPGISIIMRDSSFPSFVTSADPCCGCVFTAAGCYPLPASGFHPTASWR